MHIATKCAKNFSGLLGVVSGCLLLWALPAAAQFLRPVIRATDCTSYIRTDQICQDTDTGLISCGNGTTNSTANCGVGGGGALDTEGVQDAVGAFMTDSATIDCQYDDTANTLTCLVKDASVTFAKLADLASDRLVCRDTTGTGSPEACTVGGGIEFTGSVGIQRSALTGAVTAAAGSNATTIANDAVSNAHLANMVTGSIKARDQAGTGDPTDLTLSSATEETTPATTAFLLGWNDTGALRKFGLAKLPIPIFTASDCATDPAASITVPAPWICLNTDGDQAFLWDGETSKALAFQEAAAGINQIMAVGNAYTGAQSFATAFKVCDGGGTDCTGRAGTAFFTSPSGGEVMGFDPTGARTAFDWTIPDGKTASRRIGDGTGSEVACATYADTGLATYASAESCRPRSSGQTSIRATDGTQCSAVETVEIRVGNGGHSVVRCADNDNGFLYLTPLDPPDNWATGTLASLTVWVVSDNATPSGTVVLEPSVHCLRPDTDTLVTTWTAGSTASVTLDAGGQYKMEKIEWTNLAINGTCTSTSLIAARIRFEADSTANGLGVTGDVFFLADTIGVSVFLATSR